VSEEQQRTQVERPEVRVMFLRTGDDQPSITRAWAELEEVVGSLCGRKLYGVFDPVSREYRAWWSVARTTIPKR